MAKIFSILILVLFFSSATYSQDNSKNKLFEEAKEYYSNDQYREALNLINKFIAQDSMNVEAYKLRGNCYQELNQTEKAIADYRKAIEIDDQFAFAYYNLGNTYETIEELDSAEHYFRTYIAMSPDDPAGYFRLATILRFQNQADSVLTYFEKAYSLDSANLETLEYIMQEYYIMSDYEKTIELATYAKGIDSMYINFFLYHGLSELYQGNFQEAINQSEDALSIDSLSFEAYKLGLQAKMLLLTPENLIMRDSLEQFKFNIYTSNNLTTLLKTDSLMNYEVLSAKMKEGETLGLDDYFKLYISQSSQDSFSPYGQRSNPQVMEYYKNENFELLAKLKDDVLSTNPLMLEDIFKVAIACYVQRDMDNFRTLYSAYYGLMESILATGNGENYDGAYIVVSTSDEYATLKYFNTGSKMQALQHSGGHSYDVLTSVDEFNQEKEVYFNIDIPFGHLSKSFSKASGKKKKKGKKKRKKKK